MSERDYIFAKAERAFEEIKKGLFPTTTAVKVGTKTLPGGPTQHLYNVTRKPGAFSLLSGGKPQSAIMRSHEAGPSKRLKQEIKVQRKTLRNNAINQTANDFSAVGERQRLAYEAKEASRAARRAGR